MYVPSKSNNQKNNFLLTFWRSLTKIAGSGSASGSGSISQRYGSADPHPDPYKNVMDPQHCLKQSRSLVFFLAQNLVLVWSVVGGWGCLHPLPLQHRWDISLLFFYIYFPWSCVRYSNSYDYSAAALLYWKTKAFGMFNRWPISDPYGLSAFLISYSPNHGYISTVMHCEISDIPANFLSL